MPLVGQTFGESAHPSVHSESHRSCSGQSMPALNMAARAAGLLVDSGNDGTARKAHVLGGMVGLQDMLRGGFRAYRPRLAVVRWALSVMVCRTDALGRMCCGARMATCTKCCTPGAGIWAFIRTCMCW